MSNLVPTVEAVFKMPPGEREEFLKNLPSKEYRALCNTSPSMRKWCLTRSHELCTKMYPNLRQAIIAIAKQTAMGISAHAHDKKYVTIKGHVMFDNESLIEFYVQIKFLQLPNGNVYSATYENINNFSKWLRFFMLFIKRDLKDLQKKLVSSVPYYKKFVCVSQTAGKGKDQWKFFRNETKNAFQLYVHSTGYKTVIAYFKLIPVHKPRPIITEILPNLPSSCKSGPLYNNITQHMTTVNNKAKDFLDSLSILIRDAELKSPCRTMGQDCRKHKSKKK